MSECQLEGSKTDIRCQKSAESTENQLRMSPKTSTCWHTILLIALCACLAVGVALTSWQAYQWESRAIQAMSLSQGYMEVNDALLELLEGRS